MIRWGIIGCGTIADTRFAPALREVPDTELVAVADVELAKAADFARRHGAKRVHGDAEELCQDTDIDAVYIASPPKFHAEHTILAAGHHKHIICEKPMALNVTEAKGMLGAAREGGITLAIGYMMPFHASHKMMKRLLGEGILGKLSLVKSDYLISLPYFQGPSFTVSQFRLRKAVGGGTIMDLGPHCINTIRDLMSSEVCWVSSMFGALRFDCDADDTAVLTVRYDNGVLGVISLSFATQWGHNGIEFYGERGVLLSEQSLAQVPEATVRSNIDGKWTEYVIEPANPYVGEISHFMECMRSGRQPITSGEAGLADMRVIEAARTSMATGRHVQL